ncbi:hypothetical protein M569_05834 [Genlisea aurea]|uniref:Uncharacterized protein n=1 Tax=Genlisea aurea TaxID=192259 RepID=S8CVH5_9LAMI|nr:hypothetical protein M569_05834 [Genlisea aurea]
MPAKWRALQHRHRYTYGAVVFPPSFIEALNGASYGFHFFEELRHLADLNSTYSQLENVKKLALAFSSLLSDPNSDGEPVVCAVRLYLEIFFLENSLPLHRTLASALAKCRNFRSVIEGCFRKLCEEYCGGGCWGNGKRFCVSRAALSMMCTPKLGYLVEVVEQCAPLVGSDVVWGLQSVIDETNELSRPSPIVMEQCQEALSCMYYLFQRFPSKFLNIDVQYNGLCFDNSSVLEMAILSVLSILKSQFFPRDCLVAAGVSLFAALHVCLSNDEIGLFIIRGIFNQTELGSNSIDEFSAVVRRIPYKGDLVREILDVLPLSRLCLIRGILTAVSREVLDTHYVVSCEYLSDSKSTTKTIIYDAILPELCVYAENPCDTHSNFHALTVMQICLQQIKTLLQGSACSFPDGYTPISEEMETRIIRIVWNNLEDPLSQTVKQVHLIFDLFLDIQSSTKCIDSLKLFMRKIASNLLNMGARCKGRYVPWASLTKRLGARTILSMDSELLSETVKAYVDDDVCCAATTFLKCFLEYLREEFCAMDGVALGSIKYRNQCLPPFLNGLALENAKLRCNLSTYALPALLEIDTESIFYLLASVGIRSENHLLFSEEVSCTELALRPEQQVAILVSLLKVSRALALLEGDIDWCEEFQPCRDGSSLDVEDGYLYCVVGIRGIDVKIPVRWLVLALSNTDESLRIDAAETLFLNPKTSSLPSHLEISLMRKAIPLNMRCCSTSFQMKWTSLFRKFFSRARTGLERHIKLGTCNFLFSGGLNGLHLENGAEIATGERVENLFNFLKWFSCFLFFSCYPSAPYERKIMAMELLLIMINVWPVSSTLPGRLNVFSSETIQCPYSKSFNMPDSTLMLVGSIVDSWDHLRENSFRILLSFPTPLPGISSADLVRGTIIWAKKLVSSPRVRETDAGALTLRLIFRKYVLDLGWIVKPSCDVVSSSSNTERQNGVYENHFSSSPAMIYLASLIDWVLIAVRDAEQNLTESCKNSSVHGILLTLRYTFEELNWDSSDIMNGTSEMKVLLERLLDLVLRISSLALGAVSSSAWSLPDDMEDIVNDTESFLETSDEIDSYDCYSQVGEMRSSEQILMVSSWLAMKEVSLLLGTIIRKVPLPGSVEATAEVSNLSKIDALNSDAMVSVRQLETIGSHFLEVLLKMKHNGAVDKTRAGFTALCNRLLCSNNPRLCQLTESWMELLMERTLSEGQTVDDLLRRSAGIPAAFSAFFLAEPEGLPKVLLPRALRRLLDVVKKFSVTFSKATAIKSDMCNGSSTGRTLLPVVEISKFRDEGVVPTAHAFNVLRASFNDTNLATDTSGFCAEALILSIQSFSSSHWEIRNSASLAYTSLVRRMIGFLNVHKRESARRALTALEFFHRYPLLHAFFLNELKVATELLVGRSSDDLRSDLKSIVHPSLYPMLILLSRLKPLLISGDAGDHLDPSLFMPFIRSCSVQNNFKIRLLASKALTSLVSYGKLEGVLLNIASELPSDDRVPVSFNLIHGILLQLNSLVDTNCRSMTDSSKKDGILLGLIEIVAKRSWIGRPRLCTCPMLNSCMIKLLDNMLSAAINCESSRSAASIRNLLYGLCSECLDFEFGDRVSFSDPTVQELRKQAAASFFNCVWRNSKEIAEDRVCSSGGAADENVDFAEFKNRLICCTSDESYEVRIATLKWLFLSSEICLTGEVLQDKVVELLHSEKHHKCLQYLLKILYAWNSIELQDEGGNNKRIQKSGFIGEMDRHSVLKLWNRLVSLFEITRHSKTGEALVCCMGICIRRISNLCISFISERADAISTDPSNVFSDLYDPFCYFVHLISRLSDASEPGNIRNAAARSMVASDVLAQADKMGFLISTTFDFEEAVRLYADKLLELWSTCVKLLEDEDAGLRKKLAFDVQKYFTAGETFFPTSMIQVDRVIELCFEHLSAVFGSWPDYLNFLCRYVINAANCVLSDGDLVRRVFDKEIDNHHEEKLLICHLCCSHIEKLYSSAQFEITDLLVDWRSRFLKRLMSFIDECSAKRAINVDWIGGVGNHKNAFLPVYANLLAFYALSNCILKREPEKSAEVMVVSEVSALGETMKEFLGNPLIANLYLSILRSHEERSGNEVVVVVDDSGRELCYWEEFQPYFLLR